LVFCLISPIGGELSEGRNQRNSFRLLERVKKQRKLERQKLERDKQMILKHAEDRERRRSHTSSSLSSSSSSSSSIPHSLETLSHGSSYVSSLLSREDQLKSSKKLSKLIKKHNKHQRESDNYELSSIHHLLSLDKHQKHHSDSDTDNSYNNFDDTNDEQRKQKEKEMENEQKRAERKLHRLEKQEKERREELLDGMKLGNTESVSFADETERVFNQIVGNDKKMIDVSVLLETNAKAPEWATKPVWWKVPPSEIGDAGSAPWPNDPMEQNGYPATIIDPNNYPLSNVDDPNNYPAIDDPNGAFAPIQQPQ